MPDLPSSTASPQPQSRRPSAALGAALAAFFVALLIGAELVAVAGASTWAVASSMHIGGAITTALEGIAVVGSLIATALVAKHTYKAELRLRQGETGYRAFPIRARPRAAVQPGSNRCSENWPA